MAKKKTEVTLQEEVNTQEEWESMMQREGLIIADIYQDWCGPCKAVVALFKRIKAETNDELLNFVVAKADTIESLERYRGKCEPCFLFYGGGCLVAVVRGANPPVLERSILSTLKQEHEVRKGEVERVEIRDPVIVAEELAEAEERRRREEEEDVPQEVTIAVLKPDIVAAGKVDEVIEELEELGIEILQRKEHFFTLEEAENFYDKLRDEPYFLNLVDFMTSGPCEVLVCAKGAVGVIEELRGLIGPALMEAATTEAPDSIRSKFATDNIKNAIHAADSTEEAARELAFFYPDFEHPTVRVRRVRTATSKLDEHGESEPGWSSATRLSCYHGFLAGVQRTVALLRPQAYELYKDEIIQRIKEAGFMIAIQKEIRLTKEQAEQFYSEHIGEAYFGELTTVMSSGPLLALCLARQDAVTTWRSMLGPANVEQAKAEAPDSLRARYAMPTPEPPPEGEEVGVAEEPAQRSQINLLHGSDTDEAAELEMDFFFPVERTLCAIKPDAYANRDEIIERIKLAGFHVAARRDTTLTADIAGQLYSRVKDKPFFDDLVNYLTSGRTLFMVLTRQDAVAGWRALMGETDPDQAAAETSEAADPKLMSIRSVYGRNILENAVHGSSSVAQARENIELVFGDPDVGLLNPVDMSEDVDAAAQQEEMIRAEDSGAPSEAIEPVDAISSPVDETSAAADKPISPDVLPEGTEEPPIGTIEETVSPDGVGSGKPDVTTEPSDIPTDTKSAIEALLVSDSSPATALMDIFKPVTNSADVEDPPPDGPTEIDPSTLVATDPTVILENSPDTLPVESPVGTEENQSNQILGSKGVNDGKHSPGNVTPKRKSPVDYSSPLA